MATELENDFEYLLHHSPPEDPTLPENLVRAYYGYAHTLINLLFQAPDDPEVVLKEIFTDTVRHLDKYLLGTNFKLWFTRRAIKVGRKRLKTRTHLSAHWPPRKQSPDQPADISSKTLSAGTPLELRLPPFSRFLPLALAGPLGLSLPELSEYFKTGEKAVVKRIEQAARTFMDQIDPGWTSLPTSPEPVPEHRDARQAALLPRPDDAYTHSMDQGHLTNCPQCSAFTSFFQDLSTYLRSWAAQDRRLDGPAVDRFIDGYAK